MKNLKEILGEKLIARLRSDNAKAKSTDIDNDVIHPDLYLFMKWAYRVEKGWYGFSLGKSVPSSWALAIDEFLTELETEVPFNIHQIKLKFGGLRFYVDLKLHACEKRTEIENTIEDFEDLLFSKGLIY